MEAVIQGRKGGSSKPRPAVEAPDSLHSTATARVLDLLSEGPIGGLVDGLRSVYLDETPIQAADGSMNFSGVTLDTRPGSQDQAYLAGFPSVESETAVGVELTQAAPYVRAINNADLSAVRLRLSVPRLARSNPQTGDINGYRVEYAIDLATDGGAYVEVLRAAFDGKTTTKYERSHRIELGAGSSWVVRVRRITANATDSTIADETRVESITEVIDAKLRYPNSALAALTFDAAQFSGVPGRAYEVYGRVLRVPSNYDPAARSYTGVWDGTFKLAFSDNPAWVYYDLILHTRYGLGDRVTAAQVDKWALYQIARYCDELVPDGRGGLEPRFTCFIPLTTQADALKVLQDIATLFRGMTYWAGGSVMVTADLPQDPVHTFSNADVVDGKFRYPGSRRRTRYTVALVSWSDPADFGRRKVEYVPDPEGIARYGIQQTEITAFGCSSQGQAQRLGRWALLTSRLETESVVFSVGLKGAFVRPGQVIRVADARRAGRRIGGRLSAADADSATVDSDVTVTVGDRLVATLPSGQVEVREVVAIAGRRLQVAPAWSEVPRAQSAWAVESDELVPQQFRVVRIAEAAPGITYEVTAVKHVPGKFEAVDSRTHIDAPPISIIPPGVQAPPTGVTLEGRTVIEQGAAVGILVISWTAAPGAVAYEVEWRRDSGEWVYAGRTGGQLLEVTGIYAGRYVARVRAISALEVGSVLASSAETQIAGKTTPPPVVSFLHTEPRAMALGVSWGFPEGLAVADTQRTELWYSESAARETAIKLGDFAYPQAQHALIGLPAAKTFFFWARLVDRAGNVGAWYPEGNGVMGQSKADATELLDYLAGEIGESELASHLQARLNLIDGAASLPGSVAYRVAAEAQARGQDIAQVTAERIQAVQGEADARAAAILAEAAARQTAITQVVQAQESADSALSARIDTVSASAANNAAAIQAEQQARATADSAEASARATLAAQLRGSYTGSQLGGVTGGLLYQEALARQAGDESLAQQITLLSAGAGEQFDYLKIWHFDSGVESWTGNGAPTAASGWLKPANHASDPYVLSPTGLAVNGSQYGQLRLRVRKIGAPVWAGQVRWATTAAPTFDDTRMLALPEPTFDGNGIGLVTINPGWAGLTVDRIRLDLSTVQSASVGFEVDWVAIGRPSPGASAAALSSEQTARASADAALASDIQSLQATFQGQDAELRALVTAEASARATADSALSQRVDGVFAQVNPTLAGDDATLAGNDTVIAGVWSEQSARANADSALSTRIDTAQAKANDASAAVQQVSQAQADTAGKLAAMWSVKLAVTSGGKYYAAGMGIGIENTPSGMQSQVLFQADRFAVINTANGVISTPFVIQGGQVFINSAVIGDSTITMAKIASALQSLDYVAGSKGWRLTQAGEFELNSSVAGQGRMTITHRAIKVFDANGVKRVQLGDLNA